MTEATTGKNGSEELEEASTTTSTGSSSSNNTGVHGPSSTELRMDPNYKWLLKDLNLNNDKRMIDVTAMIELNESKQNEETGRSKNDEGMLDLIYFCLLSNGTL